MRSSIRWQVMLWVGLAFAATPGLAEADAIIYDGGGPDLYSGSVSDLDWSSPVQTAESFVLNAGANTVTDIHWWGTYFYDGVPYSPTDLFTFEIYDDDGGLPGNLLWTETAVLSNRVDTGEVLTTNPDEHVFAYEYVLATPQSLTPGNVYYLSIFNDTEGYDADDWIWVTAGGDFGEAFQETLGSGNWYVLSFDHAFRLTGPGGVIPEPSTIVLAGLGLVGMARRAVSASRSSHHGGPRGAQRKARQQLL